MSKDMKWELDVMKRLDALEERVGSDRDPVKLQANMEKAIAKEKSDLPLNVRVAKALGKKVVDHCVYGWIAIHPKDNFINMSIRAYDTDLTLAMGALEEYRHEHKLFVSISQMRTSKEWRVFFSDTDFDSEEGEEAYSYSDSLPTAICESIAKHSEGVE